MKIALRSLNPNQQTAGGGGSLSTLGAALASLSSIIFLVIPSAVTLFAKVVFPGKLQISIRTSVSVGVCTYFAFFYPSWIIFKNPSVRRALYRLVRSD